LTLRQAIALSLAPICTVVFTILGYTTPIFFTSIEDFTIATICGLLSLIEIAVLLGA
jgi:uncharacterized BrkB/YihY/UPF0761 family membrane protein